MKPNPHAPNPEERQRMVNDAMKDLKASIGEVKLSPPELLVERAKEAAKNVNRQWRLRTSANSSLLFNKQLAMEQIGQLFIDEFRTWSKDELLFLCAMLQTEAVMEQM